ncbi:putative high affinity Ca2+/Mn2+ P-type ATPase [Neoconidiobolus thromboides FSU 785]|nr:putative high affinity Ca2+/Mn2+ P-type ATPase [Neoconidiobolus thromboides FSU 785]
MDTAYNQSIPDLLIYFSVDPAVGLTYQQIQKNYQIYGYNEFEPEEDEPLYMKIFNNLKENHMILLLLVSAFISLVMGNKEDAISITLAIVLVFTVGFIQEYKSEQSLAALKKLTPSYCNVLREGHLKTLLTREIIPGDIIILNCGDKVPADLRIIECVDLEVDQSTFTGENEPIIKNNQKIDNINISINEQNNMLFMGTIINNGHAKAIVINNAKKSQFGKVVEMMQDMTQRKTPLQQDMDKLGHQLSLISLIIISFIFIIGLIQGRPILDMFNIAVSLAVAAIPEGLPVVVMVTLALGVLRMSYHKVIIKKMACIETLGCMDVLCMDKTGTLTENQLKWTNVYFIQNETNIDLMNKMQLSQIENNFLGEKMLEIACLCNNSFIAEDNKVMGQSTDVALMNFYLSLEKEDMRKELTKTSEIAFHSNHKFMQISYSNNQTYFKGSIEIALKKCLYYYDNGERLISLAIKNELLNKNYELCSKGLRVLTMAYGKDENNLVLLGLIALSDPPRLNLSDTMNELIMAGVKVVMITGDSEQTAKSIGQQIHLPMTGNPNDCITGDSIDNMNQEEFLIKMRDCIIFSRTSPYHKMKIIQSYQSLGYRVGMTGDGVNDAAALKMADIGLAMAKNGTDVAKESADLLILNDELNVLLLAIKEGKTIFNNIQNFITFQLSTSMATLSLISIATLLGFENPLNPMQILWINILMDGPPAQSLGVEPSNDEILYQKPRKKDSTIINKRIVIRIIIHAMIILIGTLYIYTKELEDGIITKRDTTMTFTTFVLFDLFNALNCRDLNYPLLLKLITSKSSNSTSPKSTNRMFWLAILFSIIGQLAVIYLPFFQTIFQTEAIGLEDLFYLLGFTSSLFFIMEIVKFWELRKKKKLEELGDKFV